MTAPVDAVNAKPAPTLAEVDAWVARAIGHAVMAPEQPVYETTQMLLRELGDDPGLLCELTARLASLVVGRGTA